MKMTARFITFLLAVLLTKSVAPAQTTTVKLAESDLSADSWKWINPEIHYHQSKNDLLNQAKPVTWADQIIANYIDAHNAHNWDNLLATCDENVELHTGFVQGEPLLRGKSELREYLIDRMSRNPELQCQTISRFVAGNTVVAHEVLTVRTKGASSVLVMYQITDGRISRIRYEPQP